MGNVGNLDRALRQPPAIATGMESYLPPDPCLDILGQQNPRKESKQSARGPADTEKTYQLSHWQPFAPWHALGHAAQGLRIKRGDAACRASAPSKLGLHEPLGKTLRVEWNSMHRPRGHQADPRTWRRNPGR